MGEPCATGEPARVAASTLAAMTAQPPIPKPHSTGQPEAASHGASAEPKEELPALGEEPGTLGALTVLSPLTGEAIVAACNKAARRGELPGFAPLAAAGAARLTKATGPGSDGDPLFTAEADSQPFDATILATALGAGGAPGTTVRLSVSLNRKMPLIYWIVLIVSVWPGVIVTETAIKMIVPGWRWLWETTWYWYLPLSIVSIPMVLIPSYRKSKASARASLQKEGVRIAKIISGRIEGQPASAKRGTP